MGGDSRNYFRRIGVDNKTGLLHRSCLGLPHLLRGYRGGRIWTVAEFPSGSRSGQLVVFNLSVARARIFGGHGYICREWSSRR
jgi:hypothetical protein